MKKKSTQKGIISALVCLLVLVLATSVFAQGKGGGKGGSKGGGGGSSTHGGGPPTGTGRSDHGRSNASTKSNGRSDDGAERARRASANLRHADDDLRNHPGVAKALHTNANDLRGGYQAALVTNPDLTFGNYVSATRLGQNLNRRFPNVTRDSILVGLGSGRSLGQTLQDLGLNEREAKEARKRADAEIKAARKNN